MHRRSLGPKTLVQKERWKGAARKAEQCTRWEGRLAGVERILGWLIAFDNRQGEAGPSETKERGGSRLRRIHQGEPWKRHLQYEEDEGGVAVDDASIWRTWKPYAIIFVLGMGAWWWWNSQSHAAASEDGNYQCQLVFVNAEGRYEALTDDSGATVERSATVSANEVVELEGVPASDLARLGKRNEGVRHFLLSDDFAAHSFNALACDFTGA